MEPLRIEIAALASDPSPIDLTLIKAHCRIDNTAFDTLLPVYLMAAIDWAEGETNRTIYERAHSWVLRDFPDGEIRLPRGLTQSVESIQYVDSAGVTQTLTGPSSAVPGTDYDEDLGSNAGGIITATDWPAVDTDAVAPVVINFTAGWASADVPQELLLAILLQVGESTGLASSPAKETLISGWRLSRVY